MQNVGSLLREAEDTLALNKRISSNAMQKALLDAGNGNSASALDTLKKAIMLIQQGKFGTDPRNAVIIDSLQVSSASASALPCVMIHIVRPLICLLYG